MNKTPLIIVSFLILVCSAIIYWIWTSSILNLANPQKVNSSIAIFACLGAFISATFVVYSYLHTNKSFIESQRPHLLIQVENLKAKENNQSETLIPMTRIHYRNITNNRFLDLTIGVKVSAENREIDLSDLFRPNMTMIGLDSRQRTFAPISLLNERGLNIRAVARKGNEVKLNLTYTYTFNKKREIVEAQLYRWDAEREEWSIC